MRHWSIGYNYTDIVVQFLECITGQKKIKKKKSEIFL